MERRGEGPSPAARLRRLKAAPEPRLQLQRSWYQESRVLCSRPSCNAGALGKPVPQLGPQSPHAEKRGRVSEDGVQDPYSPVLTSSSGGLSGPPASRGDNFYSTRPPRCRGETEAPAGETSPAARGRLGPPTTHFPTPPAWRARGWEHEGTPPGSWEPPPGSLTFRTRFFRMLSTANTCSPMADSSMRGGGRAGPGPGRARPGAELRARGCGARWSGGRRGPGHPRPGAHAHAHARTPPRAPSRRRRSIFEPAQRFPRRERAGERAGVGGAGARLAPDRPRPSSPPTAPRPAGAPPSPPAPPLLAGPALRGGRVRAAPPHQPPPARGNYLACAPLGSQPGRGLNTEMRFPKIVPETYGPEAAWPALV